MCANLELPVYLFKFTENLLKTFWIENFSFLAAVQWNSKGMDSKFRL